MFCGPRSPADYHDTRMNYLLPAVILIFCAPAVFVPPARIPMILTLAVIAFAAGAGAVIWGRTVSPATLEAHPALLNSPLHPAIAVPVGGVLVLFGLGLFLALASRFVLQRTGVLKTR